MSDTENRGSGQAGFRPTASTVILIAGVFAGLIVCYFIAAPFLPAIVWSVTLALLFMPLQVRLEKWVRSPSLAACLAVMLAALLVVVPSVIISGLLLNEAMRGAVHMAEIVNPDTWTRMAEDNDMLAPVVSQISGWVDLTGLLDNLASSLSAWSGSFIQGSIKGLITMLVTFFFLFYFLRDRGNVIGQLEAMLPFTESEFAVLTGRVSDTIYASVYGTMVVATVQGALGGLMFWWLGLPSPFFWGFIMGLLAIVPFLGAFVVWVPAAVILAVSGDLISAIILALWGTIVVGLIDNIIYPILVGGRLRLHSAVSFVAILGGLVLFGPSGVVLGPLIFAVSQSLLLIARGRMKESGQAAGA
ncbi:AI-2E family transporter [Parasphingorhabdus sp.]|uniref:AI-2E family transporter n=1 Tax=Parasphingorhabdus sp. TaxID=2709688 RepID=UPI003A92DF79